MSDSTDQDSIKAPVDGEVSPWRELIEKKMRFVMTSGLSTALDYVFYLFLVSTVFVPVVANVVSYTIIMILNFILQRYLVFNLERKLKQAFKIAMLVSFGGMVLSTIMVYWLNHYQYLAQRQYLLKMIATGTLFFYNFYLKRYAFERKFV